MNYQPKLTAIAICGAIAGFFSFSSGAQAITSQFNTRASWEMGISDPITTEDFNSIGTGSLSLGANNLGAIVVTVSSPDSVVANNAINSGGMQDVNGSDYYRADVDDAGGDQVSFTITFPTPVTAWAFDFNQLNNNNSGQRVIVTFDDVNTGLRGLTGVADGFIGWTSDTPFTFVAFNALGSSQGDTFGIDDLSFVPVPFEFEAGLGLGALAILWGGNYALRKRRRLKKA
jgi:hypothetical protein